MRYGKRVMSVMLSLALLGTSVSLTGCGSSSKKAENGELNLFIWTEYVPDSVISDFEKEYGIKVNVSTFSSNEDMLAKVKSEDEGTYDIVQPSDYMVESMIKQEMLEKLDQKALTNLSNIGDQYLDPSYDPGNVYSVPYQGGVAAIGVNTDKVKTDIKGYKDLFDTSLKGQIVALDDYRAVIGMTERSMGLSMNETDTSKLSKVADKLQTIKDNIAVYDSDSPKSSLISGDCNVSYCWAAEIALAMEENPAIKIVFPEEGAYKFIDNWAICKGAKNYDNAMKFINYMCDDKVAGKVIEEFPYLNVNQKAVEANEDYSKNEAKNIPSDVFEKGEFVSNLDTDALKVYNDMWNKLKN